MAQTGDQVKIVTTIQWTGEKRFLERVADSERM
jgi:hypothetical protein